MGDKAVVDVLIDEVASGSAPWQKQWQAGDLNRQYNPYGGVLFPVACQMTLLGAGYSDPRWLLPGQIEDAGLTLKPDAVGTPVFTMNNYVQTAGGNDVVKTDEPVVVQYMVFNAEQVVECDRHKIPKFEPDRNTRAMLPEERLVAIAENMGVRIESAPDMPGSRLESQSGLIGELCRAAVAQCRGNSSGGDVAVSTREAMAAMLLAQELGAGYQPPDGQSLCGWAEVVRNDPRELYRAVKDAEQAKGFLMQFDVERRQSVVFNGLDKALLFGGDPSGRLQETVDGGVVLSPVFYTAARSDAEHGVAWVEQLRKEYGFKPAAVVLDKNDVVAVFKHDEAHCVDFKTKLHKILDSCQDVGVAVDDFQVSIRPRAVVEASGADVNLSTLKLIPGRERRLAENVEMLSGRVESLEKDRLGVDLQPSCNTVVRIKDAGNWVNVVRDLDRTCGIQPHSVIAEPDGVVAVLYKHDEGLGDKVAGRVGSTHPELSVAQGGRITPLNILLSMNKSVDFDKFTSCADKTLKAGHGVQNRVKSAFAGVELN